MKECFRCKSPKTVKGIVVEWGNSTSHRQNFKPDGLKFMAMTLSGGVPLDAYACLECGFAWTETDPVVLRAFVEKNCKLEAS